MEEREENEIAGVGSRRLMFVIKFVPPTEVGECLFLLSLTTIRGRQTATIGKLN